MKKLLLLLPLAWLIASCASLPQNTDAVSRKITCGPGSEDIELDSSSGKPRLIISCNQRRTPKKGDTARYAPFGEIMEYGFDGKPATIMPRVGGPQGAMFNPHGFSIAQVNGKALLYVVNHSKPSPKVKQNHIEVYAIQGSTLQHLRTISGPELVSPNDCFATARGDVYYTNDSGKHGMLLEKMFRARKSTVYCVTPDDKKIQVAKHLAYANGVYVQYDSLNSSKNIYISTVQQKGLFKYGANAKRENIMKIDGQDNVMKCGHYFVVSCHPKPIAFLKHAVNPAKLSPTHVWALNIQTGKYQMIFADDGSRVSTGSTGIYYKGKLYVSQVFQPYVLEVDLPGALNF